VYSTVKMLLLQIGKAQLMPTSEVTLIPRKHKRLIRISEIKMVSLISNTDLFIELLSPEKITSLVFSFMIEISSRVMIC